MACRLDVVGDKLLVIVEHHQRKCRLILADIVATFRLQTGKQVRINYEREHIIELELVGYVT